MGENAKQLLIFSTERLDLTNLDDVKAWWDLRRYIQVDFLDESAAMDYCGVLTLQLTLCFMVTGAFDWLANGDVFSPGIILVVLLVACLGVIMFTVMQDQGVLVDAAADVVLSRQWNAAEVASLLHSIERRVAMLDDKQQILGITITETSRNAWVVSLLFAFLGSLLKVLQDMRGEVAGAIRTMDAFMWNFSLSWANESMDEGHAS
eukprot:g33258.t1